MKSVLGGPGVEREAMLAEAVRRFMGAAQAGARAAEQVALETVCACLGRFLDALMQDRECWDGWIDGVVPATDVLSDAVKIGSDSEIAIRGYAIWCEKGDSGRFWVEPFHASVEIAKATNAIVSYEFNFGNVECGLGSFAQGKLIRRTDWYFPVEWIFTASKSDEG